MALNLNRVIIAGRVGQDPQVKGGAGKDFVSLSVATSRRWKDRDGEQKEDTQWHKVVIFAEPAVNFAKQYIKKGDLVIVEGSLETRKWEKDGVDTYITEVVIRPYNGNIMSQSLSGGSRNEEREERAPARREERRPASQPNYSNDLDDDIPF